MSAVEEIRKILRNDDEKSIHTTGGGIHVLGYNIPDRHINDVICSLEHIFDWDKDNSENLVSTTLMTYGVPSSIDRSGSDYSVYEYQTICAAVAHAGMTGIRGEIVHGLTIIGKNTYYYIPDNNISKCADEIISIEWDSQVYNNQINDLHKILNKYKEN